MISPVTDVNRRSRVDEIDTKRSPGLESPLIYHGGFL